MPAVNGKIPIKAIIKNDSGVTKQMQSGVLSNAIKELSKMFSEIVEIGKFEKVRVEIPEPLKDCSINKASIIIEPSAIPSDFRTRVLSFIAYSPKNPNRKHSEMAVKGTKFQIDEFLIGKNKSKLTSEFKAFLKKAEKEFEKDYVSTYSY